MRSNLAILLVLTATTALAGEPTPNAAHVEVDPETETLFVRAADFAREKQFVTAVRILTKVMQSDSLVSDDEQLYTPAYRAAEEMLLKMPPEALNLYRLANDAEASALLARAWGNYNEHELGRIVRHYFLTRHGDEAAYRLACLHLDKHRFQTALALLTMIRKRHPDPSIPEKDLQKRILVARALSTRTIPELPTEEKSVADSIKSMIAATPEAEILDDWPMSFGTPQRNGQHKPVSFSDTENSAWVVTWRHRPSEPETAGKAKTQTTDVRERRQVRIIVNGVPTREAQSAIEQSTESIAQRWELGQWLPTDQLITRKHFVYGTDRDGIYCVDLRTGRNIWQTRSRRELPTSNPGFNQFHNRSRTRTQPLSRIEKWSFSDYAARSLTLAGDSVLYIRRGISSQENQWMMRRGRFAIEQKEESGDLLTACNANTGKQLWTIGDKQLKGVYFLAGPTPCAQVLFIPFLRQSGFFLAAIETENGNLLWEKYLCDSVDRQSDDMRAAGIAVADGEVFVVTGQGLVFSVDAVDGAILWARRYQRTAIGGNTTRFNMQTQSSCRWENSSCFVTRHSLAVLPADTNSVVCIDRASGKFIRRIDASGLRYPVGISGNHLILIGSEEVRSVDLADGKTSWTRALKNVSGHGLITSEGIYIPGSKSILILAAADGRQIANPTISMPDGVPVGNLYVKNDRVLVAAMDSIYSLLDSRPWLQVLTNRIAENDSAETRMERGLLLMEMKQFADAAADLRIAWQKLTGDADRKVVRDRLMKCLKHIFRETADARALEEVEKMAETAAERTALDLLALQVFAAAADMEKATARYYRILKESDTLLITIGEGESKRSVDAQVAAGAAMRLAAHSDRQNLEKAVKGFAATVDNSPVGLYRLMTSFPTTSAGGAAALDAAKLYRHSGFPALAEQVLLELCRSPDQGVAATGKAALTEFGLALTVKKMDPSTRPGRYVPAPPHRLLWQHKEKNSIILIHHKGERNSEFMDRHLLIGGLGVPQSISCLRLRDGTTRWHLALPIEKGEGNYKLNGEVTRIGNLLLIGNRKRVIAIDLLVGAKAWEWIPGSQVQDISKDGSGLVVVYTLNHGRQYINILDPVTGSLRWRQSFYRLSGMQVKPGQQCLALAPSYSNNGPARALIQDRFTGAQLATVKTDTSLIWLHHSVIGRRKGKLFLRPLPPREKEISLGLEQTKVMAIRAGKKRICLMRTDQRLSMIDSDTGDFIWTTPENKAYGPISGTVYVPEEDELMVFSRVGGRKEVLVLDAKTGNNTATLSLTAQQNWNPTLAAGGRFVAVMEMGMQHERGVGSSYVFFDKDKNKLIPDTFLPKKQHIDPEARYTNYQLFIAGNRLLIHNNKIILAYGHGEPRKQTGKKKEAGGVYGKDSW